MSADGTEGERSSVSLVEHLHGVLRHGCGFAEVTDEDVRTVIHIVTGEVAQTMETYLSWVHNATPDNRPDEQEAIRVCIGIARNPMLLERP